MFAWLRHPTVPRSRIPIATNRKGATKWLEDCRATDLHSGAKWSRRNAERLIRASTKQGGGQTRFMRGHRYYEIARFLDELAEELGTKRVRDLRRRRLRQVIATAERLRREV
jgi:hypothetical protein